MTKYGYSTIGLAAVVFFVLLCISFFVNNNYLRAIIIACGVFLMLFTLNFFRDPERVSPKKDNVIVSPADGTVILIKDVEENRYIKGPAVQLSIFMSPLNVHVNRIPITGKVEYIKYVKGDYLIASADKASEKNERSEFGILSSYGKVFFTQVAGYVARRIVYDLKEGQSVVMGERFGMIKFGSRVDVVVPKDWKILVKKGDKITAGETVLFEYKKSK